LGPHLKKKNTHSEGKKRKRERPLSIRDGRQRVPRKRGAVEKDLRGRTLRKRRDFKCRIKKKSVRGKNPTCSVKTESAKDGQARKKKSDR